jgi:hypothetical protein
LEFTSTLLQCVARCRTSSFFTITYFFFHITPPRTKKHRIQVQTGTKTGTKLAISGDNYTFALTCSKPNVTESIALQMNESALIPARRIGDLTTDAVERGRRLLKLSTNYHSSAGFTAIGIAFWDSSLYSEADASVKHWPTSRTMGKQPQNSFRRLMMVGSTNRKPPRQRAVPWWGPERSRDLSPNSNTTSSA